MRGSWAGNIERGARRVQRLGGRTPGWSPPEMAPAGVANGGGSGAVGPCGVEYPAMAGDLRVRPRADRGVGNGGRGGYGVVYEVLKTVGISRFYGGGHRGWDITEGTGQLSGQTVAELLLHLRWRGLAAVTSAYTIVGSWGIQRRLLTPVSADCDPGCS